MHIQSPGVAAQGEPPAQLLADAKDRSVAAYIFNKTVLY